MFFSLLYCCSCCDLIYFPATNRRGNEVDLDNEDSEDDEDYEDEGEEDINLSNFEEEDLEDLEEEEATTPPKAKKTPPWKKATTRSPAREKKATPIIDEVVEEMNKLDVSNESYSARFVAPTLAYDYRTDSRDWVSVDFYTPALSKKRFLPRLDPSNASNLLLGFIVPDALVHPRRLAATFGGKQDFNNSTAKNQSYKKLAARVKEDCYEEMIQAAPIVAENPQEVPLPFDCLEEIEWDKVYLPNNDPDLTERLGDNMQFHGILTVSLKAVEKVKTRAAGYWWRR